MTASLTSITLSEWEKQGPADCADLVSRILDATPSSRDLIERLKAGNLLKLTELRQGLEIQAFSHVGRLRIGDLSVTVQPKIRGTSLLGLLRYAYGLRRLNLLSDAAHLVERGGFEDLLICQLNTEVQELVSRGLLRTYVRQEERLASPRGRIDLMRLALDGGKTTATLPCQHYSRVEDTLLNRVVLAGLRLAGSMADLMALRRDSQRLAMLLDEQVSAVRLTGSLLDQASMRMNRLTTAYVPAISIIRLLVEAQGVVLQGEMVPITLPGFLFDMNAFFQALMSRFLRDNLPGYAIRDEHGLKGMLRYSSGFNPLQRRSPTPRPDFVVIQGRKTCSIIDAKYRDLWDTPLPREMLYQLVVYAMSDRTRPASSILYPTTDARAREARIDVADPLVGQRLGQVCLRPVLLPMLEELVSTKTSGARRHREALAHRLAFGDVR